eukprot:ctg_434.g224
MRSRWSMFTSLGGQTPTPSSQKGSMSLSAQRPPQRVPFGPAPTHSTPSRFVAGRGGSVARSRAATPAAACAGRASSRPCRSLQCVARAGMLAGRTNIAAATARCSRPCLAGGASASTDPDSDGEAVDVHGGEHETATRQHAADVAGAHHGTDVCTDAATCRRRAWRRGRSRPAPAAGRSGPVPTASRSSSAAPSTTPPDRTTATDVLVRRATPPIVRAPRRPPTEWPAGRTAVADRRPHRAPASPRTCPLLTMSRRGPPTRWIAARGESAMRPRPRPPPRRTAVARPAAAHTTRRPLRSAGTRTSSNPMPVPLGPGVAAWPLDRTAAARAIRSDGGRSGCGRAGEAERPVARRPNGFRRPPTGAADANTPNACPGCGCGQGVCRPAIPTRMSDVHAVPRKPNPTRPRERLDVTQATSVLGETEGGWRQQARSRGRECMLQCRSTPSTFVQ